VSEPIEEAQMPPVFTWLTEPTLMGAAILLPGGVAVGPVQASAVAAKKRELTRTKEKSETCLILIGISLVYIPLILESPAADGFWGYHSPRSSFRKIYWILEMVLAA
jgi:hypothetical protein